MSGSPPMPRCKVWLGRNRFRTYEHGFRKTEQGVEGVCSSQHYCLAHELPSSFRDRAHGHRSQAGGGENPDVKPGLLRAR